MDQRYQWTRDKRPARLCSHHAVDDFARRVSCRGVSILFPTVSHVNATRACGVEAIYRDSKIVGAALLLTRDGEKHVYCGILSNRDRKREPINREWASSLECLKRASICRMTTAESNRLPRNRQRPKHSRDSRKTRTLSVAGGDAVDGQSLC